MFSRFYVGKYLPDADPIHDLLTKGDYLSLQACNSVPEYAIRIIWTQVLLYADHLNLSVESLDAIKNNIEIFQQASK